MKNNHWIRHFLICDKIAKEICSSLGWQVENFAASILDEQNGRIGNAQMNRFFWATDEALSDISSSDSSIVFDVLDDEYNMPIETLATYSEKKLIDMYHQFVIGTSKL